MRIWIDAPENLLSDNSRIDSPDPGIRDDHVHDQELDNPLEEKSGVLHSFAYWRLWHIIFGRPLVCHSDVPVFLDAL